MRKLLFLICIPFVGIAQTDFELAFNSATLDYVEMPNSSSLIANSTTFSMSCWVNPQTNTTHSGILGFRNNTDADFYLLQLQNTNNIEARFRGSSGVNYDIFAANLLDFNQWQHLAFTYDGNNIHLYKDGVLISSTPANGMITQANQSFRLGGLEYQNDVFHMNGRLDEIRLWDVALSQTEINNWMCIPIDLTHPNYNNLMGYWRLNEGTGTISSDMSVNGNNGTLIGGTQWQTTTNCTANSVQIYGCTDPLACNYDLLTTIDDSSCIYLDIFLSTSNVSCFGLFDGIISATATGGNFPLQYSLGGGLTQTSATFSNLSAGSYYIDATDVNGCTSNQMVIITEPNPLFVNAFSTDVSCFGYCDGSAFSMPSGGTSPYSYLWSNGNITDNISALCAGAYVVNITDANNCVNIETVVISEPFLLSTSINVTDETAALNDGSANAIVLGGVSPYSYSWSNGSVTNPNLNLSPGLYTVEVIDANGCIVSTSVTVNAYTPTDIIDIENASKNLINITDMLGQENPYKRNTLLFYIYDDGKVEKKIIIE